MLWNEFLVVNWPDIIILKICLTGEPRGSVQLFSLAKIVIMVIIEATKVSDLDLSPNARNQPFNHIQLIILRKAGLFSNVFYDK